MEHKALNQLLCAATVNSHFRDVLLRDPAQALAAGYFDHAFPLTPEEKELITSIRARDLKDFASQVYRWLQRQGNGHSRDGQGQNCHSLIDLYRSR